MQAFRARPLEGAYPYLWLDAKLVKVRARGHVYPKALVIAYAVHETGRREVIGLDIGETETEAFWVEFLRSLRERGLHGVRLCVSDEHTRASRARSRGCWRARGSAARCTSSETCTATAGPSQRGMVSAALREIFNAPDRAAGARALRRGDRAARRPGAEGRRAAARAPRRTCSRSTASPTRTGPSCARRTRSSASTARSAAAAMWSGSSPTTPGAIRLAGALLIEQNDEWLVSRRYLSEESLALVLTADSEPDAAPREGVTRRTPGRRLTERPRPSALTRAGAREKLFTTSGCEQPRPRQQPTSTRRGVTPPHTT